MLTVDATPTACNKVLEILPCIRGFPLNKSTKVRLPSSLLLTPRCDHYSTNASDLIRTLQLSVFEWEQYYIVYTHAYSRVLIQEILGANVINRYEIYLGLLTLSLLGTTKLAKFDSIKQRLWKRLMGWKEKYLVICWLRIPH